MAALSGPYRCEVPTPFAPGPTSRCQWEAHDAEEMEKYKLARINRQQHDLEHYTRSRAGYAYCKGIAEDTLCRQAYREGRSIAHLDVGREASPPLEEFIWAKGPWRYFASFKRRWLQSKLLCEVRLTKHLAIGCATLPTSAVVRIQNPAQAMYTAANQKHTVLYHHSVWVDGLEAIDFFRKQNAIVIKELRARGL